MGKKCIVNKKEQLYCIALKFRELIGFPQREIVGS
jgi:hypothetical protein